MRRASLTLGLTLSLTLSLSLSLTRSRSRSRSRALTLATTLTRYIFAMALCFGGHVFSSAIQCFLALYEQSPNSPVRRAYATQDSNPRLAGPRQVCSSYV